jgi:AraC family transcriptional regulator of adaptative response / DNA-3-methyladenine glycosylase II
VRHAAKAGLDAGTRVRRPHFDVRKRRASAGVAGDNAAMDLDADSCYRALRTHDPRFDGRFFVGVSSTRIYCRPVCTVRAPKRENCAFFASAAAAEVAGYRPCLRCRPELAPGHAAIDVPARLAQAAAGMIEDGMLDAGGVEAVAGRVGVSARHLRRVFLDAFGVSPIDYAQTHRLLLAKRLLTDTSMPVADVAFASGFASLRRFNALFRARYRMPPTELRARRARAPLDGDALRFELLYRPPYAFDAMLSFLHDRAIRGVESVEGGAYRRALALAQQGRIHEGWIEVTHAPRKRALRVDVSPSLAKAVPAALSRVRHAFDLACDPVEVARALGPLAGANPGLRLPGAFDGFELACRAVAGQQISVAAARTLLSRLAERFGAELGVAAPGGVGRLFPTAARIAGLEPAEVAVVGLPNARARSLVALAREVAAGKLDLSPGADVEAAVAALTALPGIGPWTAQYVAMRALAWPDAFPHPDLGVMRALGETRPAAALAKAEAWRPWRAYAVIHIWSR